tara:strand:- start:436 stop:612 length:177 start_codon:yes stop_codon:yes gene_type:complete
MQGEVMIQDTPEKTKVQRHKAYGIIWKTTLKRKTLDQALHKLIVTNAIMLLQISTKYQ